MTDTSSTSPLAARYDNGRFGPGNPGRRPGARGRTNHKVAMAILEDFVTHKDAMLERIRGNPHAYMSYVLKLLPTQVECETPEVQAWHEAEVEARLARARAALSRGSDGREALIELEAVLLGESPIEPAFAALGHRINGV